jgi:hypothetical protein
LTEEVRDDEIDGSYIYVLPAEQGMPAMAILGRPGEDLTKGTPIIWSADSGCWTHEGHPVPPELSDIITEHVRRMGVPGF